MEVKECEIVKDKWSQQDLREELSRYGVYVNEQGLYGRWLPRALIRPDRTGEYTDRDRMKLVRLAFFYQTLPGKPGSRTKTLKEAQRLLLEDMRVNKHLYDR